MTQNRATRSAAPPRETPRKAVPPRPRAPRGPREGVARPMTTVPRFGEHRGERGERGERHGYAAGRAGAARRDLASTAIVDGGGLGPLTGLGVVLALLVASSLGALLDLLLVGGPAWALTALYIAACGYTAGRVRRRDWYCALVAPPLAFAATVLLLAYLMPDTFGHGMLGLAASSFELLAGKAKALYAGTALTAIVLLTRRIRARRIR